MEYISYAMNDKLAGTSLIEQEGVGYLDSDFDLAAISDLSHRERAAFKPIYSMNKWWARRSSAVFRAILLGLALPPGGKLMDEYYENHQSDPRLKGKIVLDPFMGGGTTAIEAVRLGYKAVGVDLNPLSWFIVKIETTKVSIDALRCAFRKLEEAVAASIASMYQTQCPCCGEAAEIIYAFWAKTARCLHAGCGCEVTMFRDYMVGQRRGDAIIRYYEVVCPQCALRFDWEQERACVVPEFASHLERSANGHSNYSVALEPGLAACPRCHETFTPVTGETKAAEKKMALHALLCPACNSVFSHRGAVPDEVECLHCAHRYNPRQGTTDRGHFTCQQGHRTAITDAVAGEDGIPLGFRLYAIEGYCAYCARKQQRGNASEVSMLPPQTLPGMSTPAGNNGAAGSQKRGSKLKEFQGCPNCRAVNHKFFKRPDAQDLARYQEAVQEWERFKSELPYPQEAIYNYEKTNRLVIHNYKYWSQLFNPRQLLALSRMLKQIMLEQEQDIKEALLAAFLGTLEHQNMLNIYYVPYAQSAGAFGRHDFHPKVMACEGNPWGGKKGRGTFLMAYETVLNGKDYLLDPYEAKYTKHGSDKEKRENVRTGDSFAGVYARDFTDLTTGDPNLLLRTGDARDLAFIPPASVDHVVTDPPYADAVQYAEMSDFFYVWLRVALRDNYPELFSEPETPKTEEIVENIRRRKSQTDFHQGLQQVFVECHRVLKPEGRLVFTFHHSKGEQWSELLEVLLRSGFMLNAAYPVKSEATGSGNLVFHSNSSSSIAYDIIHVCQKVPEGFNRDARAPVYWHELVPNIRQQVMSHIEAMRAKGDSGRRLAAGDVRVMLWGECLAVYSHAAGKVLDSDGEPMKINIALRKATELVEEVLLEQHFAA
jgi:hypothetical protein